MVSESNDRIYRIKDLKVSTYLAKLLSEDVANQYCLAPISLRENHLVVASAYYLPRFIVNKIEKDIRYPLEFISASFEDIRVVQSRLYKQRKYQPTPIAPEVALQRLGLVTGEQLESLMQKQAVSGKYLPTIALEDHLITEAQWGEVAGLCTNSPHFSPRNASPLRGIGSLFSMIDNDPKLLPVWWIKNDLYLATSDPDELDSSLPGEKSGDFNTIIMCAPSLFQAMKRNVFSFVSDQSAENEEEITRMLVHKGWLSEREFSISREVSKRTLISLRSVAMEQYGISSKQWLAAYAASQNIPSVYKDDLRKEELRKIPDLLKLLPANILFKKNIFPISLNKGCLSLAVLLPDPRLMELISIITGYSVIAYLTNEETLQFLFDQFKAELHNNHYYGPESNTHSFADFLLRTGFLQENQYQDLLKQKNNLRVVLTESKVFNESELVELLSFFYQIPSLSLEYFQFDEHLIDQIPAKLTLEHHILPLFVNNEDIWVAISDPETDIEYLNDLEQFTKKRVWPVLAPRTLVVMALARFYQVDKDNNLDDRVVMKLIDQLVGKGMINRYDANQAMREVHNEKIPLDLALLKLGKLDKHQLYKALSDIYKFGL
jgi:ribosomal protein S8